jgi:hypothetical protein
MQERGGFYTPQVPSGIRDLIIVSAISFRPLIKTDVNVFGKQSLPVSTLPSKHLEFLFGAPNNHVFEGISVLDSHEGRHEF